MENKNKYIPEDMTEFYYISVSGDASPAIAHYGDDKSDYPTRLTDWLVLSGNCYKTKGDCLDAIELITHPTDVDMSCDVCYDLVISETSYNYCPGCGNKLK